MSLHEMNMAVLGALAILGIPLVIYMAKAAAALDKIDDEFEGFFKQTKLMQKMLADKEEAIALLNARVAELTSKKESGRDLREFLMDVQRHGYGFVRIDPNNIFQRSPRDIQWTSDSAEN